MDHHDDATVTGATPPLATSVMASRRTTSSSTSTSGLRLVSLLPSITEILCACGLSDTIVGITHECDHPPDLLRRRRPPHVVTTSAINPRILTQAEIHTQVCGALRHGDSLYGLDGTVLRAVAPDLIFTQSLCDVCAVSYPTVLKAVDTADDLDPVVVSLEPQDLQDCLQTFHVAAKAIDEYLVKTGRKINDDDDEDAHTSIAQRAHDVTKRLEEGFEKIRHVVKDYHGTAADVPRRRPTVVFLEWHDPIFCGGHWIVDMIDLAGGHYVMPIPAKGRSVALTDAELGALDPDVILIGPCGFDLHRTLTDTRQLFYNEDSPEENNTRNTAPAAATRTAWWHSLRAVQQGRVYALDGNAYYARPGPRLLQGTAIMAVCIHDDQENTTTTTTSTKKKQKTMAELLGPELVPSTGGYQRILS